MNANDQGVALARARDRYLPAVADGHYAYDYAEFGPVEEGEPGVDLRALWSILYRNRYFILGVVALSLLCGLASILLTAPTYRAHSSVQIEQQGARVLGTEDVEPTVPTQEAERFLQTQVDILKSRALAVRVAETLNLFGDQDFVAGMGAKPAETGASQATRREQVMRLLQDNLNIALPRNSRIVDISFDSGRPALAAKVANAYSENLISSNLQRRFETSSYSREFLQNQLGETKARLEESERGLLQYARSAGLIDTNAGISAEAASQPGSLTTSNLVNLNQAYSAARSNRVQAQQRWQQAQATPLMSLPEVLGNPAVQQLTQQRAQLEAQYQEERQRRKEEHPAVQQAAARIKELDRQITTLAASIRNSIRDQYLVAQRQESALAGNVGQLKGETLAEQDRGVRYNILKREVDTNRELYNGLLQRFKEVSAQAGITSNNISIIDRAEPPLHPVSPRPALNMAVAGMGGLALALLLAFAREKFDDVIRAPDDVDRKLALPLLGVVPLLKGGQTPQDALENPRSPMSEAHYALRTALELSSGSGVPATLLLTSSRQSEGKSTTAIAVARDFAAAGKRVLLVDADLRKPSLHKLVGLPNRAGLSNLLARQKQPHEVIQHSDLANLDFVSSGPLPPNPAQLLASNSLGEILHLLASHYDMVILDGPPVLGLADAPRLASVAEGTIFIVEANGAHYGNAKAALKRLFGSRGNLIGAVLTKFDARKIGYGASYGYYSYEYEGRQVADRSSSRLAAPADETATS